MEFAVYLLLNLATLTVAAVAARGRRWPLFVALLLLGFGAGMVSNLIEAVAFDVMPLREVLMALAGTFPFFALAALGAVALSGKLKAGPSARARPAFTPLRLAVIVLVYELLYFTAGMLVFPFVEHFYADRSLPGMGWIALLQVGRSLLFVAWAWPLLRLAPRHAPLVMALVYSVVAGVAPLVLDNALMPEDVRMAHMVEVSVSNFLFGLVVGWLLAPREAKVSAS